MNAKEVAALTAVEHIQEGMIVGLGTGSTAEWAIRKLGERVAGGLTVKAVASSIQSEELARGCNIELVQFEGLDRIDMYIDGADEVDAKHNLIKGGGGALLREKILAHNSKKFIVIVDESKLTEHLGRFPLPVEVVPFAIDFTIRNLLSLGCTARIRQGDGGQYVTDNGHHIIDCSFTQIAEPAVLDAKIKTIPGVVETGLFLHAIVDSVIIGYSNGSVEEHKR